jgi:hypothetical protein
MENEIMKKSDEKVRLRILLKEKFIDLLKNDFEWADDLEKINQ